MTGLRIDVADLLAHAGARRALHLDAAVAHLAGSAAQVPGHVHLDLALERISDGIVARGTVAGTWVGQCSEGLEDLEVEFTLGFDELFEAEPVDGETYPIEGGEIDLEQLVRDTVVLELPLAPVCAAGHPEVRSAVIADPDPGPDRPDPRWAALSGLKLEE